MNVGTDSPINDADIAVVGMAGRVPGARTPAQLWRNVSGGVESIRRLSDAELRAAGVAEADLRAENYVKAAATLDDIDRFDAAFFGLSPREAAVMDPQHRQFLECGWEALEDAGHVPERFRGQIGVFAGCGMGSYFIHNVLTNAEILGSMGLFLARHTGNDKDFLSTRASYCFNLTGPSVSVQTACSTSLVAIHLACQGLLSGQCDLALAGGVTIEIPHGVGYFYQEGEILSPDGHCRAFDAASKGTVFASGAGVVVLRRLRDAIEDGDCVRAVIKGSAVNNDGSSKVGYLAPSVDGQAAAVLEALSAAGVRADTITYVEAHGTGTPVGDPIEIAALTQAFRRHTKSRGFCAVGSLKSNLGHLDTAAGVAGFIKVVLALQHRQLPPSLHFERPNPAIPFDDTPFYVQSSLAEWKPAPGAPRRAAVSSLGVGGTNAHVIVEEAPAPVPGESEQACELLVLSARSPASLEARTRQLLEHLAQDERALLADVAWTLQEGRKGFAHRRIVAARDASEARELLGALDKKRVHTGERLERKAHVTFLFPGGGAQYPNMGLDLYRQEPAYRAEVDRCLAIVKTRHGIDLRPLLYPGESGREAAAAELERPSRSILAVFITEYALARLLMSWGIEPSAMTGHSLGEYTAACLAGVFSLEDALAIVALRGEIFDRAPPGGMLSVPLAASDLAPMLGSDLSLAAINSPALCVASGPLAAIESLERSLADRAIEARRIHISIAAHSAMLDPYLREFGDRLGGIRFATPARPFLCNVDGDWAQPGRVATADYWVRHLRSTVQFSRGAQLLLGDPDRLFLEVGPGTTLSSLVRDNAAGGRPRVVAASMRHPQEAASDAAVALTAAGRLWIAGLAIDWQKLRGGKRGRRVPLPTYPFEGARHWVAAGTRVAAAPAPSGEPRRLPLLSDWLSIPAWRRIAAPRPAASSPQAGPWLVFGSEDDCGEELAARLVHAGHVVVRASPGDAYAAVDSGAYTIPAGEPSAYTTLLSDLAAAGRSPRRIVHAWTAAAPTAGLTPQEALAAGEALGFASLLGLSRALLAAELDVPPQLDVVTCALESAAGEPTLSPERALIHGIAMALYRELPGAAVRVIDCGADPRSSAGDVLAELLAPGTDRLIALRGGERWVQVLETPPAHGPAPPLGLRSGGTYLITGGLGGLGWSLARHLAQSYRAAVALVGRSPPKDGAAVKREIERLGGRAMVIAADVTDERAMRGVVGRVRSELGPIAGVFHAAGLIDDAPILAKELAAAQRVLAPKTRGTLALEAALSEEPVDVFVVYSSTSARLGLPGQVDYMAANAFLDAWARSRARTHPRRRTVSIAWGAWRDVGIAARAVGVDGATASPGGEPPATPQPAGADERAAAGRDAMIGAMQPAAGGAVFSCSYTAATSWWIDEHRLASGRPLLPGTGYAEIARQAFAALLGDQPLEIRDLAFLAPFELGDGEGRELRVELKPDGPAWALVVASAPVGTHSGANDWTEHARAGIAPLVRAAPAAPPMDSLAGRCSSRHWTFESGEKTRQEAHLRFGPRWRCLQWIKTGAGEALARLTLPSQFAADLASFKLHPALLDMATACGLLALRGYEDSRGLYVPFSYRSIRVFHGLSPSIHAHARCVGSDAAQGDFATFDVTIFDDAGRVLVEVDEFLMRRVDATALESPARAPESRPAARRESAAGEALRQWVKHGIGAEEGARAIEVVLALGFGPEVVVSPLRLDALGAAIDRFAAQDAAPVRRPPGARSGGDALASGSDVEKRLAVLWAELLGVEDIGLDDNFFELGGHSLLAVRLVNRIESAFKKKLRLPDVFEAPTVSQLARLIDSAAAVQPQSARPALVAVARDLHRQKRSPAAQHSS